MDLALALSFLKLWGGEVFEMVKGSCETSQSDERDEVRATSVTRSAWRGKSDEHYHMFQRPAEPEVRDENGQRGKDQHQFQCFYLSSSQGWILGLSGEEGSLFISAI